MTTPALAGIERRYGEDGFVCPVDIIAADEAKRLLDDLEAAEAELAGDAERLALLHAYPDRLLPTFDAVIRHPRALAVAQAILGPDLMVWSAGLFSKDARSDKRVSWHQDLTYWGLDDAAELTVWLALTPSTRASGCMQFIPGSHRRDAVAHVDTFAGDNLLTRGQEIAVDFDRRTAVYAELAPGQASLHHGHLFHASEPNTTDARRVGAAIRYIRPAMRQQTGERTLVALVAGHDDYRHFEIADTPRTRLDEADFARCRRDSELKRRILYAGADAAAGVGNRYNVRKPSSTTR